MDFSNKGADSHRLTLGSSGRCRKNRYRTGSGSGSGPVPVRFIESDPAGQGAHTVAHRGLLGLHGFGIGGV